MHFFKLGVTTHIYKLHSVKQWLANVKTICRCNECYIWKVEIKFNVVILEGFILSQTEIQYLITLTQQEPKIKVVLEMGGDRYFRWEALENSLKAA